MGLLQEIEIDVTSPGPSGEISNVLRKCKRLAARLGNEDFVHWVDCELNRYVESQPIPDYRRLKCSCYADFMGRGWRANHQAVPSYAVPEQFRDDLNRIDFRDGIASVTAFVVKGAMIDDHSLTILIGREHQMFPQMQCFRAWKELSGSEFEQLISALKNRILDFVIKIAAENPDAGEAQPNSQPVKSEVLQQLVTNNFSGSIRNFAQYSHDFSQTANSEVRHDELAKFVKVFSEHLDELNLDEPQKRKAVAQLATIDAQLSDEPKSCNRAGSWAQSSEHHRERDWRYGRRSRIESRTVALDPTYPFWLSSLKCISARAGGIGIEQSPAQPHALTQTKISFREVPGRRGQSLDLSRDAVSDTAEMAWKIERWMTDVFPGEANLYSEYRILPPRELAIVAAGVVDVALAELIALRLADYPKEAESFLGLSADGRAPAGSLGSRIQLALLLGVITPEDASVLRVIKNLRNLFAHRVRINFLSPVVLKETTALLTAWERRAEGLRAPHSPTATRDQLAELRKHLPEQTEAGAGLVLAVLSVYQAYFHRLHNKIVRVGDLMQS
jgi:AbiTii